MVQVARISEFVSTVAVLTHEAAQLATALGPRAGERATQASDLARDAVAKLDAISKRDASPEEAMRTAIWAMSLAALAITEAKANAHALLGTVAVHVVAPRA